MAIVFPDKKLIAIPMPNQDNFSYLNNLYKTKTLSTKQGDLLILPHTQMCLEVLNHLGINTEGCDLFSTYYQPPTFRGKTAWWWQLETAKFLTLNPYAFITSTPRTGKTLSTLMAMDFIQQQYKGATLIIAPLTVAAGGEWEKTLREFFPKKHYQLVHKNRELELQRPAEVFIINPDGVKLVKNQLKQMVEKGIITIAIFDELTEYANTGSQKWKAANEVVSQCRWRWGLTGTPGKPDKIYGQVKIINPNNVPKSFTRWRAMTEVQINQFVWIPKHGHEEEVKKAISPCIRFDKEQLMKIPVPKVITEKVPLSEEQYKITKNLVDEFRAVIEDEEVNVINASALASKMLQVSGGAVRTQSGEIKYIDASPKLEKLKDLLAQTPRKKVVFSSFIGLNELLVKQIKEWGYSCEKIDGSVMGRTRSGILNAFMEDKDPHILVCHPRTTAFGVELASADMIICYGCPMTGSFVYQQMFERISSSKQTAKETFIVHLSAGKQDAISFSSLANGVNIERNIVNLFTKNIDDLI